MATAWSSIATEPEVALHDAPATIGTRSVCGLDQSEDIACYARTDIGAAGRAVGRMLFEENGRFFQCTGFLISSQEHVLTAEHCLRTQGAVDSLEMRFGRQARACGGAALALGKVFRGDRLILASLRSTSRC